MRNGARCSRGSPRSPTTRRRSSSNWSGPAATPACHRRPSRRAGTSQSAVARLERGDADVRLSTLQRYAEALDRHVAFGVVERAEGRADDDAAELAGDPLPVPSERPVPERRDPVAVPIVYESGDPLRQLYERRTVVLGGPLDAAMATRIAAELMSLDNDRPVALLVNSPGGEVAEVFAVLDVIALLLRSCQHRASGGRAARQPRSWPSGPGGAGPRPTSTVSLRCAEESSIGGTAVEVARQSGCSAPSGPGWPFCSPRPPA